MRRFLQPLIPFFLAISVLAGSPAGAGEIVDETAQEVIEDLLKDLADARIGGKVGKKVVGRGASGTLRTLLTSSDTVICGFWQMQQHALMNELTMKGVPAETYRKAQRLGELIDRNCDKVINPEAYRNGGRLGADEEDETEEEDEEETDSDDSDTTPLDPKVQCENQCLEPYLKWRELERDVVRWQKWLKERKRQLKAAREANRKAAKVSREATKDAKAKEAAAQKIKGEAEAAGWPRSSIDPVATALRDARTAATTARRAKQMWRDAYAKIAKAKENVASAKEMVAYFRKWADQNRAIYEACVKRCLDQVSYQAPKVSIGSLRRFQTQERNTYQAHVPTGILATPAARGTRRALAPMSGSYARHVSGQVRRRPERHHVVGGSSEPHREAVAVRDSQREEEVRSEPSRPERRRRRANRVASAEPTPVEQATPAPMTENTPASELRSEPIVLGSDPRIETGSLRSSRAPSLRTGAVPINGPGLNTTPVRGEVQSAPSLSIPVESQQAPRTLSVPSGSPSGSSTGQMRRVKPPVLVIPAGAAGAQN